jgi:hypothetical protein
MLVLSREKGKMATRSDQAPLVEGADRSSFSDRIRPVLRRAALVGGVLVILLCLAVIGVMVSQLTLLSS